MYTITHEMALDLLKFYAEQLSNAERNKTLTPKHHEKWVIAKDNFVHLLAQMKLNGYNTNEILTNIGKDIQITYSYKKLVIKFDGASRGNHDVQEANKSGIAFIIFADNKKIYEYSEYIGSELNITIGSKAYRTIATNNVAEYYALIKALEYLTDNNILAPDIVFKSDSTCVVNQVNLVNATRAPHLLELRNYALSLLKQLPAYKLVHVDREYNQLVDDLVNQVIDNNI